MSVKLEADLEDFIKDSMEHWVGKHFGTKEVEEPSWNIDALSKYLAGAINKREATRNSLDEYGLTVVTKETSDEERGKFISRVQDKIERIGGVFISCQHNKDNFAFPIEGETKGYKLLFKLELPRDVFKTRAFGRWLDRQQEGQGGVLRTLFCKEGF